MMTHDIAARDLNQDEIISRLPLDILPTIFSYLEQRDCITCMRVCRAWYTIIPEYAKAVWSTLRLYPHDLLRRNRYRELCLGSHVKSVYFSKFQSDEDLYRMMQKVIDWGCTHIEFMQLGSCSTKDQHAFLGLLRQLPKLTQLKMVDHHSNVAFLHILNACPKLTRFVYQTTAIYDMTPITYAHEPMPTVEIPENAVFSNLIYLCLDAVLSHTRTVSILQRCPNVRCFLGTSSYIYSVANLEVPYNALAVPLSVLFNLCPKLVHVDAFCSYAELNEPLITADATSLQHIGLDEGYGYDQISSHLFQNQHTLKSLRLCKMNEDDDSAFDIDWSPMLRALYMSQLRSFVVENVNFDATSLVALLNQCNSLEALTLRPLPVSLSLSDIQEIYQRPSLLSLECQSLSFSDDYAFNAMLDKFPGLKTLAIMHSPGLTITIPTILQRLKNLKSLKLIKVQRNGPPSPGGNFSHSKLERVDLSMFGGVSYDLLQSLAEIPTLRRLRVWFDTRLTDDQDGLLCFVQALKSIEVLEFDGVRKLSYAVLDALASLPHLKVFREASWVNVWADRKGLLQMLRKAASLRMVFFHQIIMTDQDGQDLLEEDETIALIRDIAGYTFHAQLLPSQRLFGANQGLFHNVVITNTNRPRLI